MFTIRKATTADCALIQKLAQQIFPVTYKDILTPEQTDYMMEWMYSLDNIRKQMEEEGHVYFDLLVKTGAETPQKQENATL